MLCTDFICTYKSFEEEDPLLSDDLWRAQFLQIMGCETNYDDEIVRSSVDEAYSIIIESPYGNKFFDAAHKIGIQGPLAVFMTKESRSKEMDVVVLQAYFCWSTMDLVHNLLRRLRHGSKEEQPEWNDWQTILDTYKADNIG